MSPPRKITVDGVAYTVTDDLGYQISAGVYAKEVQFSAAERRMAVRPTRASPWRWWKVMVVNASAHARQ
jgi:hypothetical protein